MSSRAQSWVGKASITAVLPASPSFAACNLLEHPSGFLTSWFVGCPRQPLPSEFKHLTMPEREMEYAGDCAVSKRPKPWP